MNIDKLKQVIEENFVGEINNAATRRNVKLLITGYLIGNEFDYRVICDESNNTPETIDQNLLVYNINDVEYVLAPIQSEHIS